MNWGQWWTLPPYFFNKINVVHGSVNELCSTARESEELPSHLHPVLVPLHLCQKGVRNIVIPYLPDQQSNIESYKPKWIGEINSYPRAQISWFIPYLCFGATQLATCTSPAVAPGMRVAPLGNASHDARSVSYHVMSLLLSRCPNREYSLGLLFHCRAAKCSHR